MKLATFLLFASTALAQLQGVYTGTLGVTIAATVAQPTDTNSGGGCSGSSPSWSCTGAATITLADATSVATICYRTDGATITVATPGTCPAGSTTYSVPFTSPSSTFTLTAVGTKAALTTSSQLSSTYTIAPPVLSIINTASGASAGSTTVTSSSTLAVSAGDTIWTTVYWAVGTNCAASAPTATTVGSDALTLVGSIQQDQTSGTPCWGQYRILSASANASASISATWATNNGFQGFEGFQLRGTAHVDPAAGDQSFDNDSGAGATDRGAPNITTANAPGILLAVFLARSSGLTFSATANGCFGVTGTVGAHSGTAYSYAQYTSLATQPQTGTCQFHTAAGGSPFSANASVQQVYFH